MLLIYRVPNQSSRARVVVWRKLKHLGGLYLQRAVCVLPDDQLSRDGLHRVREQISELGGSSLFLVLTDLDPDVEQEFVRRFRASAEREYAEIVTECDNKLVKRIEFERVRENYSVDEAKAVRQVLRRLRRRLEHVVSRDRVGGDCGRAAARRMKECEELLARYDAEVRARKLHARRV